MKKQQQNFTLIELLTVIAIIILLAGLVIPAVMMAQNRGRITQAKADIASFEMAFKQLETDYPKLYGGTLSAPAFGGKTLKSDQIENNITAVVGPKAKDPSDSNSKENETYYAFIAELTVPKTMSNVSLNKRRRPYLEPKAGYNPDKDYDNAANLPHLWLDPWGTPYTIYLSLQNNGKLTIPFTKESSSSNDDIVISRNYAIFSYGPNATNDSGCDINLDTCIKQNSVGSDNHKQHDDIASWNI